MAAEARASEREMEEGSLRKWAAVWRAAGFWAKVGPWDDDVGDDAAAGGSWGEEDNVGEVVIFEKRVWRLLTDWG